MESQRILIRAGLPVVQALLARLNQAEPETGRLHAIWALDAIGGAEARKAIASVMRDPSARVRLQAARSAGIRQDQNVAGELALLLHDRDPAVRREAAIALARLGDGSPVVTAALYKTLDDSDAFAAWSIRQAIRQRGAWDKDALIEALLDDRRLEPALRLTSEAWSITVVAALCEALKQTASAPVRGRIVANIAGLLHQYPDWTGEWFGTNPLAGPFPRKTKDWDADAMKAVLDGLSTGLTDRDSSVRFQAITGISEAGKDAAPRLRSALQVESDPVNQAVIVETLGTLNDSVSLPLFTSILADPRRDESLRMAALIALGRFRDPQSMRARLSLVYQEKAPPALVARALPDLARIGILPPNELGSFIENASPEIRASALLSLNVKNALPGDVQQSVLDHMSDSSETVRQAAILAVVPLRLEAAVPRLLEIAARPGSADYTTAVEALCSLRDTRALAVYLASLDDSNPRLRKLAELALLNLREKIRPELAAAAQSGRYTGPARLALDRVLAKFTTISTWRVLGPFPRITPQLVGTQTSIDFARSFTGAQGRPVLWTDRRADAAAGHVNLVDFTQTAGASAAADRIDASGPLGAFAYAEVIVDRACPALLMAGGSGPLLVTLNDKIVYPPADAPEHPAAPWPEVVRCELTKGRNRILVLSRQGEASWFYRIEVAPLAAAREKGSVASTRKESGKGGD